jgi:hypothetical protein
MEYSENYSQIEFSDGLIPTVRDNTIGEDRKGIMSFSDDKTWWVPENTRGDGGTLASGGTIESWTKKTPGKRPAANKMVSQFYSVPGGTTPDLGLFYFFVKIPRGARGLLPDGYGPSNPPPLFSSLVDYSQFLPQSLPGLGSAGPYSGSTPSNSDQYSTEFPPLIQVARIGPTSTSQTVFFHTYIPPSYYEDINAVLNRTLLSFNYPGWVDTFGNNISVDKNEAPEGLLAYIYRGASLFFTPGDTGLYNTISLDFNHTKGN